MKLIAALFLSLALLAGCAPKPSPAAKESEQLAHELEQLRLNRQKMEIELEEKAKTAAALRQEQLSRFRDTLNYFIGRLTLDNAVILFGPPTSSFYGEQIIVCDWSYNQTFNLRYDLGGSALYFPINKNETMRLIFQKPSNILSKWSYTPLTTQ